MRPDAVILGIESSCDETAAAVLRADGTILAEAVFSQQQEHAAFGGVVPEIAARAHLQHLPGLVAKVMQQAGIGYAGLNAVAATAGPGLIGGLIVGASFAKGVALAHGLPFLAINHLEAHALTVRLPGLMPGGPPGFPYLLLLLSGGHCQCVLVEGLGQYRRLGSTLDDAVGEAFDKAAKLLGLPWPGGPHLERLAAIGDPAQIALPRPLLGRPGCDFSFSGLKTAVARAVALGQSRPSDIAASFQAAVAAVLADRAAHALDMAPDVTALVVAGGVAANGAVRAALADLAAARGLPMLAPPLRYCTDNAVMVAWAGIERLRYGSSDPFSHCPRPRWPLAELVPPTQAAF
ncbi:MAG: tRNA (adenosine(37)-N6)-threonylcarbamoyltransferase complex transferase subunit TsaD [Roseomonas sp.]|nr:tRNA (adenosine(37)-N6)-threonylcarbamoyltransferase complex transferase subunit TsaD [Roseomonas sp.]MCA3326437.1 tRNA (adenosine(37)-N6)-threonylcarbamoyltransferase complex transferase subunit TsaD [Roseomonas sp.]MCA3330176.1 tRNA (adenosine(37)-N6)-threonylcarbamoyltransferase complex transferase subunit TsaD [Roseomonas sp.]MCA3333838.1 tRNA (adenosine(37)-N6)-threonylcarbamoyltransferase complex transferase subunit TsaD [Roseomonas sp.]MCA3346501.1 tRNA (adenosine(37)-N6)-threonylcarb